MPTNSRKYMRDYMRRQRKPYKLLGIKKDLQRMGILSNMRENEAVWEYQTKCSLNIPERFKPVRYGGKQ